MASRAIPALGLSASIATGSCGSRTGLDSIVTAPVVVDAGGRAPPPSCIAGKSPGQTAWSTSLPRNAAFSGPWSTDSAAVTYYLGTVGPYPDTYDLLALDACGNVLWQTNRTPTVYSNQATPAVVTSGGQVWVEWGAVDGFDRATGAHVWNVSLDTLAGEKLAGDDFAEIAPLAVSANGHAYVLFETGSTATIVSIDSSGTASVVATTRNDGDLSGFILDGAANLDILFNSAIDGAYVESFSLGGSPIFATPFTCAPGFLAPLASGRSFIVMQSGACVLPIGGGSNVALGGTDTEASFGAVVVDGDDDLFATTDGGMQSWDRLGNSRWTSELSGVVGGPLLGTGNELFVATTDSSMVPTFVALDTATGATLWSKIADAPPLPDDYLAPLLTSAQELVFVSGNRAIAVVAGESPDTTAEWPTPSGAPNQARAALGR